MATRSFFVAACLLVVGCGSTPERGEVEGVVTLNGVPLPDIQIVFTSEGNSGMRSSGFTDSSGKYRLQGDRGESGVAVGRCVVVVSDSRSLRVPGGGDKAGKGKPPASRVPTRYTRFSETPLKFEIRPGSQTVNLGLTSFAGKEKTP